MGLKTFTLVTGLVVSALLAGCGSEASSGDSDLTVRVGFQVIPGPDPIVKNQKWLENAIDARVEWIYFSSGADVIAAMEAKQIDIGMVGSNPTTVGISSGVDFSIIWIHSVLGQNEALVVQREQLPPVEESGLFESRIGTPFGSTAHYSLLTYLELQGLNEEKVNLIDLQPQDIAVAWERGDIDAAYVWNPVLSQLLDSGGVVVIDSGELAEKGFPTADLGIASNSFIEDNPDIIAEWLLAQDRAVSLIRNEPRLASDIIAEEFGLSVGDASSQLSQVSILSLEEQRSPQYLGTESAPGEIISMLARTSDFLLSQNRISSLPSREILKEYVSVSPTASFPQ